MLGVFVFLKFAFTSCKAEQLLQGMELHKEEKENYEKEIGELNRKSSKKKVPVNFKAIYIIGQRIAF